MIENPTHKYPVGTPWGKQIYSRWKETGVVYISRIGLPKRRAEEETREWYAISDWQCRRRKRQSHRTVDSDRKFR